MSWPQKDQIRQGVLDMLQVNMGLKKGEKLLVVTDLLTPLQWSSLEGTRLMLASERSMLAKMVAEIANESYPRCKVEFYLYPATGQHGAEPGEEVTRKMTQADVVIAITTYSLSHTDAREHASQAGARIASMPMFEPQMFYPGGPMAVDYQQVAKDTKVIAELLTTAQKAVIRSREGTDLSFSLAGRPGQVDGGIYTSKGAWGNLPGGEAFIVPLEGTAQGQVVVPKDGGVDITEEMTFVFQAGWVREIRGGGKEGDKLRQLMQFDSDAEEHRLRRNLAELGIGTNPNAKSPVNVLEAEKIKGTVHVAVGDNAHMGGQISCDLHEDFVLPRPDLILDDKLVIEAGQWVFG
ncbi:MAG: aminopeptidase [Anaerolineae bacterium]|nr:aminopeptidase [Anaerolineae bacterium]